MDNNDGAKVFSVWSKENDIKLPKKKELILEIIDQIASCFAAGSFYYFILNFENITMDFVHEGLRDVLGMEPEEFTMEKCFERMHPEDLASMNEKETLVLDFFFNKIPKEDFFSYKSVYVMRIKHNDGTYKTLLHQASVFNASNDGKIEQSLCVHTDITHLNIPINHNVSFISTKKQSYHYAKNDKGYTIINRENNSLKTILFKDIFSKREKEIIEILSQGKTFNEIAKLLFISPHTINTHKRNILSKSGCKNTPELIAKYYINGLFQNTR
ncbi:LuxR C-terminal-related transcriptional regulator [Mariniflexile gromovii]|uniref:PAS domain-containing protein n=1 Tax=Mariniflexile gromovii TaxID=362523 RepID=A0ABS4BTZ8_9FLAO|nr:LuxR C-terminal-related transcriptional regulator [Mariniflexile gromovii]MBP0903491.1 PAS domain-containing protein [Mariniflexile gromovii]